jgi:hypothetical protein
VCIPIYFFINLGVDWAPKYDVMSLTAVGGEPKIVAWKTEVIGLGSAPTKYQSSNHRMKRD